LAENVGRIEVFYLPSFSAVFGSLLVFIGVLWVQTGFGYVLNWMGEPIYSHGLIVLGVILILIAGIPARWMDKAAAWALKSSSAGK
jgi:hypothetical protein